MKNVYLSDELQMIPQSEAQFELKAPTPLFINQNVMELGLTHRLF